jgi:hypothetical protein
MASEAFTTGSSFRNRLSLMFLKGTRIYSAREVIPARWELTGSGR